VLIAYYYAWRIVHDRVKEKKDAEENEERNRREEDMKRKIDEIHEKTNGGDQ